jgi:IS5 family transposase
LIRFAFWEFASYADEHPDFFRSRLDAMIDLRHPLAVRMPWASIEAALAPMFERRVREGRVG